MNLLGKGNRVWSPLHLDVLLTEDFHMSGQVAGVASTEFGLSRMIWAAVNVRYDGAVSL